MFGICQQTMHRIVSSDRLARNVEGVFVLLDVLASKGRPRKAHGLGQTALPTVGADELDGL